VEYERLIVYGCYSRMFFHGGINARYEVNSFGRGIELTRYVNVD
jgi:hypothetical protein